MTERVVRRSTDAAAAVDVDVDVVFVVVVVVVVDVVVVDVDVDVDAVAVLDEAIRAVGIDDVDNDFALRFGGADLVKCDSLNS